MRAMKSALVAAVTIIAGAFSLPERAGGIQFHHGTDSSDHFQPETAGGYARGSGSVRCADDVAGGIGGFGGGGRVASVAGWAGHASADGLPGVRVHDDDG